MSSSTPEGGILRARAVVATYNPGPAVVAVVGRLVAEGIPVLVVDDASNQRSAADVLEACADVGAEVRRMETNRGIGRGLNAGVEWLLESGDDFLLTLDQDTTVPPRYVQSLIEHFLARTSRGERVGIVAPALVNDHLVTSAYGSVDGSGMSAVVTVQSGSLFPASVFRELGSFREDFIMDCIDHDFCLRVRRSRATVALAPHLSVAHALGEPSVARFLGRPVRLLGRERHVTNHSPARRYYMTRNALLLAWWHKRDLRWLDFVLRFHFRAVVVALLFEDDRRPKRAAVVEGVRDAFSARTGPRGATTRSSRLV